MIHTCHAIGCSAQVLPKYLMCFKHWKLVPVLEQSLVWKWYRKGQEVDKLPSPEYLAAAAAAIRAVAIKEGRIVPSEEAPG